MCHPQKQTPVAQTISLDHSVYERCIIKEKSIKEKNLLFYKFWNARPFPCKNLRFLFNTEQQQHWKIQRQISQCDRSVWWFSHIFSKRGSLLEVVYLCNWRKWTWPPSSLTFFIYNWSFRLKAKSFLKVL